MKKSFATRFFLLAAFAAATVQLHATLPIFNGIPTILRAGTSVFLRLNEEVNDREFSVGNTLEFIVDLNVTVNQRVTIAAGAPARGTVRKVERGCNGKCAKLTIVVESAQAVDGQTVLLQSNPHVVQVPCCDNNNHNSSNSATAIIGSKMTTTVRNDITIHN